MILLRVLLGGNIERKIKVCGFSLSCFLQKKEAAAVLGEEDCRFAQWVSGCCVLESGLAVISGLNYATEQTANS